MNNDLIEKNMKYQHKLEEITKQLYYYFYFDDVSYFNPVYESWRVEQAGNSEEVRELTPKAEKILRFFDGADEAKKVIHFLHSVDPVLAKAFFDKM